jgi:UDP-N-acetyl-D-galactosamine dehydrogenase
MDIAGKNICIIGLGYVGLPLAISFADKYKTIGFDIDIDRVGELQKCVDRSNSVAKEVLQTAFCNGLILSSNIEDLRCSDVYIVAVPTPVDAYNHPDLTSLIEASRIVGNVIRKGCVVIYESTVYPGVTEEICVPEIEKTSGLVFNVDFYAGYSPERVNPGDSVHTVDSVVKVTSGSTPEIALFVDNLYNSILKNGTYPVSSIKVAEASKIVENSQRDVNIAFMNEIAKIFGAMGIDTTEVIAAASSKWNFVKMSPGLVGGHCIGVDPYYLIQKAQVYGVMPRVMMAARKLNDGMGEYVANQVIKLMNKKGIIVKDARIMLLGFTFKENCKDIRNTKVADIYSTLSEYTGNIVVVDPWADASEVYRRYGISIVEKVPENDCCDAVILCVAHEDFREVDITSLLNNSGSVVYDVKSFLPREIVDGRL